MDCDHLLLCTTFIYSVDCISFGSVSFLSVSILFNCSSLCILASLFIQLLTCHLTAVCCLSIPHFWSSPLWIWGWLSGVTRCSGYVISSSLWSGSITYCDLLMHALSLFCGSIHGPMSSCCIATIGPIGKREIFMWVNVSLFNLGCLAFDITWSPSLLSYLIGYLLNLGNSPLASLLNRNVAGPGRLGIIGVDFICNKNINMSALVSYHFFIVLYMNLMHALLVLCSGICMMTILHVE